MRPIWLAMVLLVVPLAGCIGGAPESPPAIVDPAPEPVLPPLPDAIEATQMVVGGMDVYNFVTGEPCSMSTSSCWRYPFVVEAVPETEDANETDDADAEDANATGDVDEAGAEDADDGYETSTRIAVQIEAALTWGIQSNDFDLYLLKDGQQVAMSAGFIPQTTEAFTAILEPGAYELVVAAWAVSQDSFKVTGAFSHVEVEEDEDEDE